MNANGLGNHPKMNRWLALGVAAGVAVWLSSCTWIGRASLDNHGLEVNGSSLFPATSSAGRYVAFQSNASTLVANDTNGADDIFVRDLKKGTTTRVSLSSSGGEASGNSRHPAISADGRYVVFNSRAENLVAEDNNGFWDIFVRDTVAGTTTRVSVDSAGKQSNNHSRHAAISDDGMYIAFQSTASSLVAGDTNGVRDVFVHNRITGVTSRVSVANSGGQSNGVSGEGWGADLSWASRPAISADGRYIAFQSDATNLVSGDTNAAGDVFVRDVVGGTTIRASLGLDGKQNVGGSSQPTISDDGRHVGFVLRINAHLFYVFEVHLRDTVARTTTVINGTARSIAATHPTISGDARFIAWEQLEPSTLQGGFYGHRVYVKDEKLNTTRLASATNFQAPSTEPNYDINFAIGRQHPALSGDGRYVAFASAAPDMVPGDFNEGKGCDPVASHPNCNFDIFIRRTLLPTVTNVSPSTVEAGRRVTLTVEGTGFDDVRLGTISGGNITVSELRVLSSTQVELDITVDAVAAHTARNVTVFDPGTLGGARGAWNACRGCLSVISAK